MLLLKKIEPSQHPKYKYIAYFNDNTTTKFGAKGYEDYTIHKDKKRRTLYITRHSKDLRTNDPRRAGYLSMYILWNKPTLQASIQDYKKRLKIFQESGVFPTNII
jgi:hypothetical protein